MTRTDTKFTAIFNNYAVIESVRVRTSNSFIDAIKLQGAKIIIGKTDCGQVPDEVIEATWYKIDCSKKVVANSGTIIKEKSDLVISEIEFILATY